MERYASTLAVTAACAGLLLAAHHRIVSQRDAIPTKPIAAKVVAASSAAASTPQAWVEPPAKPVAVAATPERIAEAAPAPEPVVAAAASAPVLTASTPTQHAALRSERSKRAEQMTRARKLAQARDRRTRIAARAAPGDTTADRGQAAVQAAPAEKPIDPIGDLLRGIGIGREG